MLNRKEEHMSQRSVNTLKELFAIYDAESKGYLTVQDFERLVVGVGEQMKKRHVQRAFLQLNKSRNNQLVFNEFALLQDYLPTKRSHRLLLYFLSSDRYIERIADSVFRRDLQTKENKLSRYSVLQQNPQWKEKEKLILCIHDHICGSEAVFATPYNKVIPITYCDYIASGKPLSFIEDYLREQVITTYANTHTTTSYTGFQTSGFRQDSRNIIRECVNASSDDVVIFTGSGSTSAIALLVHALDVRTRVQNSPQHLRPAVIISPYEHHSNILPWREEGALVIQIPEDEHGRIDYNILERELQQLRNEAKGEERMIIGSFCAGSNVTGIVTDTDRVCKLLHQYKTFCFFDYAAIAPYVDIDMNPKILSDPNDRTLFKDAVFISPHKFIGGPSTPGLLIAKRACFQNPIPHTCGGGTVFFVSATSHLYLPNIEDREEGGTPDIIGSIRGALVFKLKNDVGAGVIKALEDANREKAFAVWTKNPNLIFLGNTKESQMPFFSFLIKHGNSYLHYNYVSLILNDLFGIQTRGGCACAGPYGISLLGMTTEFTKKIEQYLSKDIGNVHIRPGFTRLNLNYFLDDDTVDFIIRAVDFVGLYGAMFLPYYAYSQNTHSWYHVGTSESLGSTRKKLTDISFENGILDIKSNRELYCKKSSIHTYEEIIEDAKQLLEQSIHEMKSDTFQISCAQESALYKGDKELESLRWYIFPSEVLQEIKHGHPIVHEYLPAENPIQPKQFGKNSGSIEIYDNKLHSNLQRIDYQ